MWPEFEREAPFRAVEFTTPELLVACMGSGATMGFGYFVVYHAVRLTLRVKRFSPFILLVWGEIFACATVGLLAIFLSTGVVRQDNFWVCLFIIIAWMFQSQCLIQIIVNRICILIGNQQHRTWLKLGMFLWIGWINIAVATIWIPSALQISEKWHEVNVVFDRMEKILYLITDAGLNYLFMWIIQQRLVSAGLTKYKRIIRFNKMIIWVSLAMDVLIVGLVFLPNPLLYPVFHPLAFIVKLEIEMAMSNLILMVARGTGVRVDEFVSASSSALPSFQNRPGNGIESVRVQVQHEEISVFDGDDMQSALHEDRDRDVKAPASPSQDSVSAIPMKPLKGGDALDGTRDRSGQITKFKV